MIPTVTDLQKLFIQQLNSILKQDELSPRFLPEYRMVRVNIYNMLDVLQYQVSLEEVEPREIRLKFCSDVYTFVQESPDEVHAEDKFICRPDYIRDFVKKDFSERQSVEHTSTLDFAAMLLGYAGWGGAQLGILFTDLVPGYQFPYELIDEVKSSQ